MFAHLEAITCHLKLCGITQAPILAERRARFDVLFWRKTNSILQKDACSLEQGGDVSPEENLLKAVFDISFSGFCCDWSLSSRTRPKVSGIKLLFETASPPSSCGTPMLVAWLAVDCKILLITFSSLQQSCGLHLSHSSGPLMDPDDEAFTVERSIDPQVK